MGRGGMVEALRAIAEATTRVAFHEARRAAIRLGSLGSAVAELEDAKMLEERRIGEPTNELFDRVEPAQT